MARLVYSASMSPDGFIAGAGGDMSWPAGHLGPDPAADRLAAEVGALLVGNRTFRGDDPHRGTEGEGEAFGGGWSGPQFVLTRNVPDEPVPGVTFVSDLRTGVARAAAAAGDRHVNVLGASVARQCLEAGLLDEIWVFVVPVLLGDGTRLFEHPGGHTVPLERIEVSGSPTSTGIRLRVRR